MKESCSAVSKLCVVHQNISHQKLKEIYMYWALIHAVEIVQIMSSPWYELIFVYIQSDILIDFDLFGRLSPECWTHKVNSHMGCMSVFASRNGLIFLLCLILGPLRSHKISNCDPFPGGGWCSRKRWWTVTWRPPGLSQWILFGKYHTCWSCGSVENCATRHCTPWHL